MEEIKESVEKKRGIEYIGLTDNQLLVKANIEKVSQAFCQVRQAIDVKHNVYGREVKLTDLWTHIRIEMMA
jgi:hypothetical protein